MLLSVMYISHNQSFYTTFIAMHVFGRALLGDTKAQVGLSFMYDAPPGAKQEHEVSGCFSACNLVVTMLITKLNVIVVILHCMQ